MTITYPTDLAFRPEAVEPPLEIPPPPPSHPFRLRRVVRLIRELRDADDPIEAAVGLLDAVGGDSGERIFQRFVAQPEGWRLLRTRPDLAAYLGDHEALAALPGGSLGRAYLDFARANDFSPDGLMEKNKSVALERPPADRHREWFWDRYAVSHDLWHVLTGCSTSAEGESVLLAFIHGHTPQRAHLVFLTLIALGLGRDWAAHRRQWRGWRAGRRAVSLIAAPWEELLAWPLEEVRRCFGVGVLARTSEATGPPAGTACPPSNGGTRWARRGR